jgi:D-glycerate 3-kinase
LAGLSGKTHLTRILQKELNSPHDFQIAVLSIDDLYLDHDGLVNILWTGRGQPGTHDIKLGANILQKLFLINQSHSAEVELPVFEKTLFNGEGDRLPSNDPRNPKIKIKAPPRLDIVIFEGWCTGFSIDETSLINNLYKYLLSQTDGFDGTDLFDHSILKKDDLLAVNRALRDYDQMWKWFTCFIQVCEPIFY